MHGIVVMMCGTEIFYYNNYKICTNSTYICNRSNIPCTHVHTAFTDHKCAFMHNVEAYAKIVIFKLANSTVDFNLIRHHNVQ